MLNNSACRSSINSCEHASQRITIFFPCRNTKQSRAPKHPTLPGISSSSNSTSNVSCHLQHPLIKHPHYSSFACSSHFRGCPTLTTSPYRAEPQQRAPREQRQSTPNSSILQLLGSSALSAPLQRVSFPADIPQSASAHRPHSHVFFRQSSSGFPSFSRPFTVLI